MPHPRAARLRGLMTAILTPFTEGGRLALEHMPALIAFQKQAGIDGLIVCGTNGEGTSLSVAERKATLETVLAHKGDLTIVAGTGATSLTDALDLTRHAADAGADAVLVLPPFFFSNPTAQGVADYFHAVLDAADLPVLLYNIPQHTGVVITDDILSLLAGHPNLAGIKDSTGKWDSTSHYITTYPDLKIFAGSDRMASRSYGQGGAGGISGGANAFPEFCAAVRNAHRADPHSPAVTDAQAKLDALMDITVRYPLIAVSKSVLAHRGLPRLSVRPPLVNLTAAQETALLGELREGGYLKTD